MWTRCRCEVRCGGVMRSGMYALPHKKIEELRAELQEARAECKKNTE